MRLDLAQPDPLFDAAWYRATYPDLAGAEMSPWAHFAVHGDAELRAPGPGFDPEFYRRTYQPLEATLPFTHFVHHGRAAGHLPSPASRDAGVSSATMRELLAGLRNPVLLIGNDAQRAGAPILLLGLAERLRARGWSPIFLLARSGPLFARFQAAGPTLIADEGWELPAFGRALPKFTPILVNTGWGARLAGELGVADRCVVLVHEMPAYLAEHGLLEAVGAAHTVVASTPATRAQLAPVLAEGAHIETVLPGLRPPASSSPGRRSVRRRLEREFGPGAQDGPVYLSAGYADHRKGFDLFLAAARRLQHEAPGSVFVWLGELSGWAAQLADAAVDDGVRLALPGFLGTAADWYAEADVYLLTSRQDPGPTTVVDAACLGVPFVGLEADIGLRSLGDIERIGSFVGDVDTLAERAAALAASDTIRDRAERALFARAYRPFDEYADEIIELLAETRGETMRLSGAQRLLARAQLSLTAALTRPGARRLAFRAFALPGRARRRARRMLGSLASARVRRQRLASVVVLESSDAAASSTQAPASSEGALRAAMLEHGDRVWFDDVGHLQQAGTALELHLVRQRGPQSWALVRAVEAAGERIDRIAQYDAAQPPRWVRNRSRPPRPRTPTPSALQTRTSVSLVGADPVRCATPIGVFLHAYYLDVAEVIADRLQLIDQDMRVYVSTDSEEKAEKLRVLLPGADVRVFPNRGQDVYPKVFGFAAEHARHELVLHLHTKRSAHSVHLVDWLPYLLDCLLPSERGVNAILSAFASIPELGMVSPSHFPSLGAATNWGPNRAIAEVLTWGRGWPRLPGNGRLVFPAGSMFWARTSALAPLQDLAIPLESFTDQSAADGTVAHAVERLLGVSCEAAGLHQLVVGRGDRTDGITVDQLARLRSLRRPPRRPA